MTKPHTFEEKLKIVATDMFEQEFGDPDYPYEKVEEQIAELEKMASTGYIEKAYEIIMMCEQRQADECGRH